MSVVSDEEVRYLLERARRREVAGMVQDMEVNLSEVIALCGEVLEYRSKKVQGKELSVLVEVKHSHTDENGVQTDIDVRAGTAEEAIKILNHLWE